MLLLFVPVGSGQGIKDEWMKSFHDESFHGIDAGFQEAYNALIKGQGVLMNGGSVDEKLSSTSKGKGQLID